MSTTFDPHVSFHHVFFVPLVTTLSCCWVYRIGLKDGYTLRYLFQELSAIVSALLAAIHHFQYQPDSTGVDMVCFEQGNIEDNGFLGDRSVVVDIASYRVACNFLSTALQLVSTTTTQFPSVVLDVLPNTWHHLMDSDTSITQLPPSTRAHVLNCIGTLLQFAPCPEFANHAMLVAILGCIETTIYASSSSVMASPGGTKEADLSSAIVAAVEALLVSTAHTPPLGDTLRSDRKTVGVGGEPDVACRYFTTPSLHVEPDIVAMIVQLLQRSSQLPARVRVALLRLLQALSETARQCGAAGACTSVAYYLEPLAQQLCLMIAAYEDTEDTYLAATFSSLVAFELHVQHHATKIPSLSIAISRY